MLHNLLHIKLQGSPHICAQATPMHVLSLKKVHTSAVTLIIYSLRLTYSGLLFTCALPSYRPCPWLLCYCRWRVDGNIVSVVENDGSKPYPQKDMYVYTSVWDASFINNGAWCGTYNGNGAPYHT